MESIAARYGYPQSSDIYEHPKNEKLRKLRPDPSQLACGDVVTIPDRQKEKFPIGPGSTKKFTAKLPRTKLKIRFDKDGKPLASEPFVVEVCGEKIEGTTTGEGMLEVDVPPHAVDARVVFTKANLAYTIQLGHIDPIDTDSGVAARLKNLGYYNGPPGASKESWAPGLKTFQTDHGLEPTGEVDEATAGKLKEAHGA